jgi:hypothetical protein
MGGGVAQFFALATLTVGLIALADLVIHPKGTAVLTSSAVTAEKTGTNALLGQTS